MDTILIVDDDQDILRYIQTILSAQGYQCLTATDGLSAQSLLDPMTAPITAILLDWVMAPMSGIDLLRWIKKQPELEHIPVIMQTVMDSPQHIKAGIDAGAFYHLIKPTNQAVLLSIVRAAVSDYKQKQALFEKIRANENPFRLLMEGMFRFRTLTEGEDLVLKIANTCPDPEKAVGIVELVTNAIEHGNLGIQYDEKTEYIAKGTWSAEIERRLALPEHAKKSVEVRFKREPGNITVLIQDQGRGFSFEQYLELDPARAFDTHGRGIAMVKVDLDLHYLWTGNQALVTIPCE